MTEKKDVKNQDQDESKATDKDSVDFREASQGDFSDIDDLKKQIAEDDKKDTDDSDDSGDEVKDDASDDDPEKVDDVKTSEDGEDTKDGIDPKLLEDIFGEQKEKVTEQTTEQKLAELERKNEKLYKKLMEKDDAKKSPPPPMTPEETKAMIEKSFPHLEFDTAQDLFRFNQAYYNEVVLPEWERRQAEKARVSEYKDKIKEHKYYKYVASEVDAMVKDDPKISNLPEELKWDTALEKALVKKLPELLKAQAKRASEQAKSGKKLILRDQVSSETKATKGKPKHGMTLTEGDLYWQKRMGLSDKDLETFTGDRTVIEEPYVP